MRVTLQPLSSCLLFLQEYLTADLTDEALFWVESRNCDLVHAPVLPEAPELHPELRRD